MEYTIDNQVLSVYLNYIYIYVLLHTNNLKDLLTNNANLTIHMYSGCIPSTRQTVRAFVTSNTCFMQAPGHLPHTETHNLITQRTYPGVVN